jgi:hypothetical protein
VVSWIRLFLFVILVGLSMDYHVFVLGRKAWWPNKLHVAEPAPERELVTV